MEQMQNKVSVRQIQEVQLEILKAVIQICKKHDIHYVAFGGTCLGAVRHKGFIPWDDDIDILMPREDYNSFMAVANDELPDFYRLHTPEDLKYPALYVSKIFDERTTCIEKDFYNSGFYNEGVFVDIMVLDGVSDNALERKIVSYYNILLYKVSYFVSRKFKNIITFRSKVLYILSLPLKSAINIFVNEARLISLHKKLYKKFDSRTCSSVSFNWSIRGSKRYFPSYLFKETCELPFENIFITCPKDYDTYLRLHYGNYMQLPPENQRGNWHNFCVVDLNHSYKDYDPKTGGFKK